MAARWGLQAADSFAQVAAMDSALFAPFSRTVAAIHTAALQPHTWPQALQHIATLHAAPRALVSTPDLPVEDGGFVMAHAMETACLAQWTACGAARTAHDPWTAQARRLGLLQDGNVLLGEELVPDAQLLQSLFYREFLRRQGIRRLCSGVVFSGRLPGLPLTLCAVFRGSADTAFTEANRQLHTLLTQHLALALGTALRLRDAEFRLATSLQALDRLHTALLLLGRRGNVLFANRNALALLAQGSVLSLRAGNPLSDALGWLQAPSASAQAALQAQLHAVLGSAALCARPAPQGLALHGAPAQGPLLLHTVPLPEHDSDGWCRLLQPGALVFITHPQALPQLEPALLQQLYGISSAECRVAQQLLRGQTLQATALHLHLGENTVKTHLQQLFDKTRTSRQPQLLRLLLALAAQY